MIEKLFPQFMSTDSSTPYPPDKPCLTGPIALPTDDAAANNVRPHRLSRFLPSLRTVTIAVLTIYATVISVLFFRHNPSPSDTTMITAAVAAPGSYHVDAYTDGKCGPDVILENDRAQPACKPITITTRAIKYDIGDQRLLELYQDKDCTAPAESYVGKSAGCKTLDNFATFYKVR